MASGRHGGDVRIRHARKLWNALKASARAFA
jgi:hypothetical protein